MVKIRGKEYKMVKVLHIESHGTKETGFVDSCYCIYDEMNEDGTISPDHVVWFKDYECEEIL